MKRILCVEDSLEVQTVIQRTLSPEFDVIFSTTIKDARKKLSGEKFNLLLLDVGLPDGDGLRYCSELKSSNDLSSLPIVLLTACRSIHDKVMGFSLGIEDFISKPFDPIELRVRIESRLRKIAFDQVKSEVAVIGLLRIDFASQRASLTLESGPVDLDLSHKEFRILVYLAKNVNRVKSREAIISAVWSDGLHLSDRVVDSHISRIRKKLKGSDCYIEAVQNSGYRLSLIQKRQAA
jgi:DNA-binding response OmpR family regulator